MTEKKYRLIFKGEISEGAVLDDVKERLGRLFKKDVSQIETLFTGEERVIKKSLDREKSEMLKRAFENTGAVCTMVEEGDNRIEEDQPIRQKEDTPPPPPLPKREVRPSPLPADNGNDRKKVKKTTLILLAALLGGIGAHKFYIKKYLHGILYFLFCWTLIPLLISLVDIFVYATKSDEEIDSLYEPGASVPVIVFLSCFVLIAGTVLIGIVAAIFIPNYLNVSAMAKEATVKAELFKLSQAEHDYHMIHGKFTHNINDLPLNDLPAEITLKIESADEKCFLATGRHTESAKEFVIDCDGIRNGKPGDL